jgi:hypothetical protein
MKAPGTKRLKLKYDGPLSNFAFKFNLRRCNEGLMCATDDKFKSGGDFIRLWRNEVGRCTLTL